MIDIRMPQLGESVTEGTITGWRKKPGDAVALDEPVCEVSTDKVTFEVPAPQAGRLAEILVPEGTVVAVGSVIARLEAATARPTHEVIALPEPEPSSNPPKKPPEGPASQRLSPLVRRLARETGIDPRTVEGTGLGGRVTRDDMLLAAARERAHVAPAPASAAHAVSSDAAAFRAVPMDGDEVEPFSAIRQATARHMIHSVQTAPHGFISYEVDYGAIEAVRRERKEAFRTTHGIGLTYLPFVIRAAAIALRQFPLVNSAVDGNRLIVRKAVNIGIAVDLAYQGLMVPVVRDADVLTVTGIARAVADLAARARSGRLKPEEMAGGTFTVTNPGPSGTYLSIPIINQPQAAILVTDGVHKRPTVATLPDGTDVVAVRPKGFVGLSMDHRAFDGAYAANFLALLKVLLEERDWRGDL